MQDKNELTYRQVGDYLIPNLTLPPEGANIRLGKWGMLHKDYLIKHKGVVFATLLTEGKVWQYLADIDTQANICFFLHISLSAIKNGFCVNCTNCTVSSTRHMILS